MNPLHRSYSYPERLSDADKRERIDERKEYIIQADVLEKYRHKDYERAEHLSDLGSFSSTHPVVIHQDWRARCCASSGKIVNYFLERGEETKRQDEIIQRKSYAGFYYFIKWFVRALFFLVFTTLGTIAGKEIGCEIKDHETCSNDLVDLVDSSPHLVASIIGLIFGLFLGQWLGRFIWDHVTKNVQSCLRKLEKCADTSKIFLIILSVFIYITITGAFIIVFLLFVDLGQDKENIVGGIVGGCIGLICAGFAYRKSSSCRSGEETPMIDSSEPHINPPALIV